MELTERYVIAQSEHYMVCYVPPEEREFVKGKDGEEILTNYEVVNKLYNTVELSSDCLPIALSMMKLWDKVLNEEGLGVPTLEKDSGDKVVLQ